MNYNLREALGAFIKDYSTAEIKEFGNGHINDTYLVETPEKKLILQKINTFVFKDPFVLMNNIQFVTEHLRGRIEQLDGDPERETLNVVHALDGKSYFIGSGGSFWRAYKYIENTEARETSETAEDFYQCGLGFGRFQYLLADYPAGKLEESIPGFHDTAKRFEAFEEALACNSLDRAKLCRPEINFALERKADIISYVESLVSGQLPLRVAHNDTKLNNILIDTDTKEAVCVIDLDTVMPGLVINDFGDAIRFGANTAAEDETDLSKVTLSLDYFEAFSKGFLTGCHDVLIPAEVDNLAGAARVMTFECGLRFLTDYLQGDVYFKTHRTGHNLDRARNQFALVADMERKMDEMTEIVRKACYEACK